jgi:hypothetical protein
MNLTAYLPIPLIEQASFLMENPGLISWSDIDPNVIWPLFSVAKMLEGGAKVIRPSTAICDVLKDVDLHIRIEDYAQPYDGVGVVLPGSLFGSSRDRIATSTWHPGSPIIVTVFDERPQHRDADFGWAIMSVGPVPDMTIEDYVAEWIATEKPSPTVLEGLAKDMPIIRVVINLCHLAVKRGVRVTPLDHRAQKRRRKARRDDRMARLAARDAQEVIIQDLDLILRASAPSGLGEAGSGGWRQRMHRRRGHWKMQAYGPGRSLRKRIFVQSYMVHADDNPDGEVESILS